MQLDYQLLEELGLGDIPQTEQDNLLEHMSHTLIQRLGRVAEEKLGEAKMYELQGVLSAHGDSPQTATDWLKTNLPDFQTLYNEEFNKLKEELRAQVPDILQKVAAGETSV